MRLLSVQQFRELKVFLNELIEGTKRAVDAQAESPELLDQLSRSIDRSGELISNAMRELSDTDDYRASERKYQRRTLTVLWFTGIATLLAFVAAAVYAHLAHGQLDEMRKTTVATQQGSYAACVNAQIARRTLLEMQASERQNQTIANATVYQAQSSIQSQVAQLMIEPAEPKFAPGDPITSKLTLSNIGKSNAFRVVATAKSVFVKRDEDPSLILGKRGWTRVASGIMPPTSQPGRTYMDATVVDGATEIIASSKDYLDYMAGQKDVLTFGQVSYFDTYNVHHWLHFCIQSEKNHTANVSTGHLQCATYNRSDTNTIPATIIPVPPTPPSTPEIKCIAPQQ